MLVQTLPQQIGAVVVLVVCGFALWQGGRPERTAALAMIIAWIATPLAQNQGDWLNPQYGIAAVDFALLAILVWLSLTTNRFWPLWASAFQLVTVITHIAILAQREIGAWAYLTGGVIWGYAVFTALAVGVWGAWRARRRGFEV